jgi:hypothetical protein
MRLDDVQRVALVQRHTDGGSRLGPAGNGLVGQLSRQAGQHLREPALQLSRARG